MDKEKLISELERLTIHPFDSPEHRHMIADIMLLDYLGDDEITEAYAEVEKGYHLPETIEKITMTKNLMDKHPFDHATIRALGYTAHKLAKESGTSYVQMLRYIKGTAMPSFKTARRMAQTLNIPLDSIVFAGEQEALCTTGTHDLGNRGNP